MFFLGFNIIISNLKLANSIEYCFFFPCYALFSFPWIFPSQPLACSIQEVNPLAKWFEYIDHFLLEYQV